MPAAECLANFTTATWSMDADSHVIMQVELLDTNGGEAQDAVDLIDREQQAHDTRSSSCRLTGPDSTGRCFEHYPKS